VWDASRPIYEDATLKLLTWDDQDGRSTFWHSSAHLMAEAVESLFPGVKFWVGPAVEKGFYYDMDLGGMSWQNKTTSINGRKLERPMLCDISKKRETNTSWICCKI
jgi:threonyl-tRNA synthetase